MLTGAAFFVDREEGLIWCDSCVPAEVVHLVVHLAAPALEELRRRWPRFAVMEAGELVVQHILPPTRPPMRVRARCCECGAIQPAGAARSGA